MGVERAWGRRIARRWAGYGTGAGAIAVSLAMLLSPVAAGAGHVYRAPFTTMVSSISQYYDQSGCSTATLTAPPNWSATTGVFTTSSSAKAKSCAVQTGGVGSQTQASVSGEVQLGLPLKFTTSTTHSIVVNWKLTGKLTTTFTSGTCNAPKAYSTSSFWYCEAASEAYADVYGYLIDTTNGSTYYASSSVFLFNESYNQTFYEYGTWYNSSGTFASGSFGNQSMYLNTSTLNRADTYVLYMDAYASAYVSFYAYGYGTSGVSLTGGSGTASITLAGGSDKAQLTSIVVT